MVADDHAVGVPRGRRATARVLRRPDGRPWRARRRRDTPLWLTPPDACFIFVTHCSALIEAGRAKAITRML